MLPSGSFTVYSPNTSVPAKRRRRSYLSRAAPRKAGTFGTRVIVLFYGDELRFTRTRRNTKRFRAFQKSITAPNPIRQYNFLQTTR